MVVFKNQRIYTKKKVMLLSHLTVCLFIGFEETMHKFISTHTHTQFRGSLNLERLWHLMPIELVLFRHNTEWSHLFTETKASCDFISINNKSHSSEQSEKQNASVIVIRTLRYASQQRGSTGPFNTFYVYATHLIYIVWVMRWGTNNVPCLNLSKWCVIPADTPSVPV